MVCVLYSDVDIGYYRCVTLRTGGSDGIDLTQVTLKRKMSVSSSEMLVVSCLIRILE